MNKLGHMSQHIFKTKTNIGNVEVAVGFDPDRCNFHASIFKHDDRMPAYRASGLQFGKGVREYLLRMGIKAPDQVIDAVDQDYLDSLNGQSGLDRKIRFYEPNIV